MFDLLQKTKAGKISKAKSENSNLAERFQLTRYTCIAIIEDINVWQRQHSYMTRQLCNKMTTKYNSYKTTQYDNAAI